MRNLFITGTDTGVGKTHVAVALIHHFNTKKFKTFGIKPIASGGEYHRSGKLMNADALALQTASSIKKPYKTVNPIMFDEPIAPHIAAKHVGVSLTLQNVIEKMAYSLQSDADINIIEGVGGWSVPLNEKELVSDVVGYLNIPVILVVGIKLGCLNHAILTSQNITQMKVPFIGWIANCIAPDTLAVQENIITLRQWLGAPYLGSAPYQSPQNMQDDEINFSLILSRLF